MLNARYDWDLLVVELKKHHSLLTCVSHAVHLEGGRGTTIHAQSDRHEWNLRLVASHVKHVHIDAHRNVVYGCPMLSTIQLAPSRGCCSFTSL